MQDKEIDQRIKEHTQKLFNEGSKEIARRFFPVHTNDVPNRAVLMLVVLGLDNTVGDKKTNKPMDTIVRECGTSGRTYKSALIFSVPDAACIQTAMRWERHAALA